MPFFFLFLLGHVAIFLMALVYMQFFIKATRPYTVGLVFFSVITHLLLLGLGLRMPNSQGLMSIILMAYFIGVTVGISYLTGQNKLPPFLFRLSKQTVLVIAALLALLLFLSFMALALTVFFS